jgi:3'-phosphoadenosine 5'-phosphosulfate sulfotransferase (PAPS reductase)/FAD synthetase
MNPYKIDGPTCISFSGGRTSAYMLHKVLQEGGQLPNEAIVCFANTGKEDEATLKFVQECSDRWNVEIHWVERRFNDIGFERVTFETASRNGEPFEELIKKRNYLPNPVARICTSELKIRAQSKYLASLDFFNGEKYSAIENFSWIGIRADEQRRAAKIADKSRLPLWADGVTKETVGQFWKSQPFDLGLPNNNGVTMHGNCDLCFLKPAAQVLALIAEKPERAVWWAKMEALALALASKPSGAVFRSDRPSYAEMIKFSASQKDMFDPNEETIACFCGD